jgi:hypothetical protein
MQNGKEHLDVSLSDICHEKTLDGGQQFQDWIRKTPPPQGRPTRLHPALYGWDAHSYWAGQLILISTSDDRSTLD